MTGVALTLIATDMALGKNGYVRPEVRKPSRRPLVRTSESKGH
jgi:hypothetical protein